MLIYIIGFLAIAVFPFALAAYGGHLAAKVLEGKKKRNALYWVWSLAILGIITGGFQQYLIKKENDDQQNQHKDEMAEQRKVVENINRELIQSQLSQEYLKGQNNVLALLIGKSGDKLASAIKEMTQSSSQATITTNKQICSNTMDLVKRIHNFARDRREKSSQLSEQRMNAMSAARNKTEQEQSQIWQQYNALEIQRLNNDDYQFRSILLGEAIYLKDELLKRLPSQPKPSPMYAHVFEFGSLAGVYPEEGAADYLENLARKLCPQ